MPTYEYRCKSCGHELEVQQSFSDDPLETCTECGGDLRKVYGTVGISFKGSGFYKTDTRPSASRNGKSGASPDKSSSTDKSSESSSKDSSSDKTSTSATPKSSD